MRSRFAWRRDALAAAVLLCVAAAAPGQAPPPSSPPPPQPADRPASIALTGQVELARLVDLAAERLKLSIEYDPQALKTPVTLRLTDGVTDEELWALLNRVLAARGFTIVRLPGNASVYSVVKLTDAAALARLEEAQSPDGATAPAGGFQTVILRAKHRPAKELIDAVKQVLSKTGATSVEIGPGGGMAGATGSGGAGAAGGLILVSDLTPRIDQAIRILELLDVPGQAVVIEEIPARNLPATSLAALVMQVATKREAVSGEKVPGEILASPTGTSLFIITPVQRRDYWRSLVEQLDQREAVQTVTYTPEHFGLSEVADLIEQTVRTAPGPAAAGGADDRWRLVIDELTGALIITATPTQHQKITEILDRLASVPLAARRPVRSFKIKNRPVKELTGVLGELMQAGILEAAAAEEDATSPSRRTPHPPTAVDTPPSSPIPVAPVPEPPPPGVASPLVPGAANPGTSTLRQGSAPTHRAADSSGTARAPDLILTSDEATSTIIAIGEPRLLGQLEQLIKTLDIRQPQVMLEVMILSLTDSQALSLGVELTRSIDLSDAARASLTSLFGLSALAPDGSLSVGAAPGFTGVVLDPGNFAAVIRALETLNSGRSLSRPRLLVNNNEQATFSSVLQQPVATIATSTSSTIQSFGGTQDAGTTASIKPQIAEGDHLVLDYQVKLSSFSGTSPGQGLPPPRQENSIQSLVTIPDGFTVVVGGLEVNTDAQGTTQIPFIGSIPILGEAFKSRNNTQSRSRFYVFIHATVLRQPNFEDLKYLSGLKVAESGLDDGWPVVEPRVIK